MDYIFYVEEFTADFSFVNKIDLKLQGRFIICDREFCSKAAIFVKGPCRIFPDSMEQEFGVGSLYIGFRGYCDFQG